MLSVRSRRTLELFGLALSLVLAAYAQAVIGDAQHWTDGWPLLSGFDSKLTELYAYQPLVTGEQSVGVAVVIFAAAMLLFAWAAHGTAQKNGLASLAVPTQKSGISPAVLAGATVASGGWSFLIVRLATGSYEGWYVALYFTLLIATAGLFFTFDARRGLRFPFTVRIPLWELAFVFVVTGIFAGVVLQDLTNWRYASLGDDGVFFSFARQMANGDNSLNLFSQAGPYGNHPLLSSAYQAAVMKVAGVDISGWKLATVLTLVAVLPVFYWLTRTLTNARTAVVATGVLASSHYLMEYAHTGYDNVFAILPTVLALALYVAGGRKSSVLLLFCAGACAGLGFYTFYAARAGVVMIALASLMHGRKRWRIDTIAPIAVGFALAVAPLFAVERWHVISQMQAESGAEGRTVLGTLSMLAASSPRVFMAFSFNPYTHHFVSGSLLDDVSAPLALLGLAYATTRIRSDGYRLVMIWFLVGITVSGLFHPRQEEIDSRLHYALPPMAIFAGIALDRAIGVASETLHPPSWRIATAIGCIGIVLTSVLGLNLYRHFAVNPENFPASPAALVYREARQDACRDTGTVVFAQQPFPVMPLVFEFYGLEKETPLFFRYDDPPSIYTETISGGSLGCILLADPQLAESSRASSFITQLASRAASDEMVTDASGRTRLRVFTLAALVPAP